METVRGEGDTTAGVCQALDVPYQWMEDASEEIYWSCRAFYSRAVQGKGPRRFTSGVMQHMSEQRFNEERSQTGLRYRLRDQLLRMFVRRLGLSASRLRFGWRTAKTARICRINLPT